MAGSTGTQAAHCAACGAVIDAQAQFCEACGSPLTPHASNLDAVGEPTLGTAGAGGVTAAPGSAHPPTLVEHLPGEGPTAGIRTAGRMTDSSAGPSEGSCTLCGGGFADGYCSQCGAKQPSPRDHFEFSLTDRVGGVCDRGILHAENQDAMALSVGPRAGDAIAVVCDGVTTAPLSERAAMAAAIAASDLLASAWSGPDAPPPHDTAGWAALLGAACAAAQAETVGVARTLGNPPEPPSCTFVAAVVCGAGIAGQSQPAGDTLAWLHAGWCGDSRLYWIPDTGEPRTVSEDDSFATQLIASGMTRTAAETDPRAHTILRWLGADSTSPQARTSSVALTEPGWVTVVSDGMWNYASEPAALKAVLDAAAGSAANAVGLARSLVAFANAAGGADNVTVALVRVGADPTQPDPTQPDPTQPDPTQPDPTQSDPTHLSGPSSPQP